MSKLCIFYVFLFSLYDCGVPTSVDLGLTPFEVSFGDSKQKQKKNFLHPTTTLSQPLGLLIFYRFSTEFGQCMTGISLGLILFDVIQ